MPVQPVKTILAPKRPIRRRNALTILATATCVMIATAGCGIDDNSTASSGDGAIGIESCGRTVILDAPAESVVVIGGGTVDTLFEMGAGDRITGVVEAYAEPAEEYGDQLGDLPDLGDVQPGREALLAHQPDLVIAEQARYLNGEDGSPTIEQLEETGIAVYVPANGCIEMGEVDVEVTDVLAEIEKMGTLLGVPDGAQDLSGHLQRQLDDVAERVEGREPVGVAYITLIGSDHYVSTGGIDADILTRAGGVSLFDDPSRAFVVMSREEITTADPEAILFFPSTSVGDPLGHVRENFPTTDAVQNDRIHIVEPDTVARTGVRPVRQLEEFARFLHPEAFGQE